MWLRRYITKIYRYIECLVKRAASSFANATFFHENTCTFGFLSRGRLWLPELIRGKIARRGFKSSLRRDAEEEEIRAAKYLQDTPKSATTQDDSASTRYATRSRQSGCINKRACERSRVERKLASPTKYESGFRMYRNTFEGGARREITFVTSREFAERRDS